MTYMFQNLVRLCLDEKLVDAKEGGNFCCCHLKLA